MTNSPLAHRLEGFGASIFAEMTALAAQTGAINLGQGFPDYDGPPQVLRTAQEQIALGNNQYPPGIGVADLRQSVSEHQKRFWGLEYDPNSEILITVGASEAIAASLLGLLNDGDEVVVFEPLFDTYAGLTSLGGAVLKPVTLRPQASGRFTFDEAELTQAFSPKSRVILLNSPHNPTGTVFTIEELRIIARHAIERDLIVISDEVYEHLVFDNQFILPSPLFPACTNAPSLFPLVVNHLM